MGGNGVNVLRTPEQKTMCFLESGTLLIPPDYACKNA